MGITHTKVTVIADDPNYDVGADEWNDDHVVTASDIPIVDSGGLITATNAETAFAEIATDVALARLFLSYRQAVIATAPVGYWRLGEATGTTAKDEMSLHAGTYNNTPTLSVAGALAGDTNTAITLARASFEDVQFTTTSPVADGITGTDATFSIWFKTTYKTGAIRMWGDQAGASSSRFYIGTDTSGFLLWNKAGGTVFTGAVDYADDAWHHAVVSVAAGTNATQIYVDGANVGQGTSGTTWNAASTTMRIGSYSGANYWEGSLDEPALWNRALSAAEIAGLYRIGTGT